MTAQAAADRNTTARANTVKNKRLVFALALVGVLLVTVASGVHWVGSLPNISVEDDQVTISNCDEPRPKYAQSVCPKLFCKRALITSGSVPMDEEIRFVTEKSPEAPPGLFEQGAARFIASGGGETIKRFRCKMDGDEVAGIAFLDEHDSSGIPRPAQ